MPAAILVNHGASTIRRFWIESDVIRIGRDPSCDLSLPDQADAAPHVATVEFARGRYLVYNRSDAAIRLGDREIPPRGKAPWGDGEPLELGDLSLLLDLDAGPGPDATAGIDVDTQSDEQDEVDPDAEAATRQASKTRLQLAVILGSALMMGLILALDSATSGRATGPKSYTLEQLLDLIRDDPIRREDAERDRQLQRLGAALQAARMHRRRGNNADARSICLEVRDQLQAQIGRDQRLQKPPEATRIWALLRRYDLDELAALDAPPPPG